MHQPIGKLARIGEDEQSGRVDVESSDGHPSSGGKARKYGRPTLRIAPRDELAYRLVINENARGCGIRKADGFSIDRDFIARCASVAQFRGTTRNRHAPGLDPCLDLSPR